MIVAVLAYRPYNRSRVNAENLPGMWHDNSTFDLIVDDEEHRTISMTSLHR